MEKWNIRLILGAVRRVKSSVGNQADDLVFFGHKMTRERMVGFITFVIKLITYISNIYLITFLCNLQ